MATVYMITSGEYSNYCVEAIYSNLDAAVKHVGRRQDCDIAEWDIRDTATVDETKQPRGSREAHLHVASIDAHDGSICLNNQRDLDGAYSPPDAIRRVEPGGLCVVTKQYGISPIITVGSPISIEHAVKVAVEKRQEWLRTRAPAHASGS